MDNQRIVSMLPYRLYCTVQRHLLFYRYLTSAPV